MPSLPNNIRYLEWNNCTFQSIPSGFLPAELVVLHMPQSSIMHLEKPLDDNWKAKKFMNLTHMNFEGCTYMREMIDFSAIPNLEGMDLSWCRNLKKIGDTIGNLKRLRELILYLCDSLTSLPSLEENERLELINVGRCSKLENLRNLPKTKTQLILNYSGIKQISLCNGNLIHLEASHCKNLTDISILGNWPNLPNFPKGESYTLSSNQTSTIAVSIDLSRNNFISLPINTFKFIQIKELYLHSCECLVEIPQLPHTIKLLNTNNCKSLERFSKFQFEDFQGYFINRHKMTENEKQSWREIVEKILMKRKENFPSMKYEVLLPGNEIPEWFSYSFNYEGIDVPYQVRVPEFNSNVIAIAVCAIFARPTHIEFSTICGLPAEHMRFGFFTGFDWPKLLKYLESRCRVKSKWGAPLELKKVGVHYIYEN